MAHRTVTADDRRQLAPWSIAIIGVGPRGLSVLERLLIRLGQVPAAADVVIWAIEAAEHGSGRIWRTGQDPWLTANATAAELTMRSPDSPRSAGPRGDSLAAWSMRQPAGPHLGSRDYPPRREYGRYLHQVFEQLRTAAPPGVRVRPVLGLATGLARDDGGLVLTLDHGRRQLRVDRAVLATGHSDLEPTAEQRALAAHGDRHPGLRYLRPSLAADMPLHRRPGRHQRALPRDRRRRPAGRGPVRHRCGHPEHAAVHPGRGGPGQDSPLCRDADAIALALLGRNAAAAAPGLRSQAAPDRRRTGSPVID